MLKGQVVPCTRSLQDQEGTLDRQCYRGGGDLGLKTCGAFASHEAPIYKHVFLTVAVLLCLRATPSCHFWPWQYTQALPRPVSWTQLAAGWSTLSSFLVRTQQLELPCVHPTAGAPLLHSRECLNPDLPKRSGSFVCAQGRA